MQIGILLDAQTEPELPSPQPPVEAIGRALPNTSTCVDLANLIDTASESPAVMENPTSKTLFRVQIIARRANASTQSPTEQQARSI